MMPPTTKIIVGFVKSNPLIVHGMGAPFTLEPRLRSFHAALVAEGYVGRSIETKEWNRIVVSTLGLMTRQGVQDATFAMDGLGLVSRPQRGVVQVLVGGRGTVPSSSPAMLTA